MGRALPFDTLTELRRHMRESHPVLATPDVVTRAPWGDFGEGAPVEPGPFAYPIEDFYRTDPISRASQTMGQCSDLFTERRYQGSARTGTYG
jgi:NADH-quinone oxidoreductase subunit G